MEEKPPDKLEPFSGAGSILGHAPQLTRNWGPFRAFSSVLIFGAFATIAVRPEAAIVCALIAVFGIIAALFATHRGWLD